MQLIAVAIVLVIPAPVWSGTPSAAVQDAIRATTVRAQDGDAPGAVQAMLDLLETLPDGDSDTHQALNDRAVISLYAGGFAQMIPDYERALALYYAAADGFRALGPASAAAAAFALDRAAAVLKQLGRPQEAYGTLMTSRGIRRDAHAPIDGNTINALRLAALIAQELRDPEIVAAELNAAAAIAFGKEDGNRTLFTAQAAAQAAEMAGWLGAYPLADVFADIVASTSSTIAMELWHWTPDREERRPYICNELSDLIRQMAGLRINHGSYGGAEWLLNYTMSSIADPMACADTLAREAALYTSTLKAWLFLRTGDPFSAHLRLQGYQDGVADANLASDERRTSDALMRARQAEARLSLGFPGEAGELLAQAEASGGLSAHPTYEREHMLAVAARAHIEGDAEAALDALAAAEAMLKEHAPLHWLPRAETAFRRALILLEEGRTEEARAVRDAFEAELAELVAGIRNLGRELLASFEDDRMSDDMDLPSEDAAQDLEHARARGHAESPAFRELDRMRLLFDLSLAAHEGDVATAGIAFDTVPQTGLPGSVGMTSHAQRAYLLSCLLAKGTGLECSMAIRGAFDYPAATPYRCVGGCAWIGDETAELVINADMFRRAPLISRFAEPVLARLVRAADDASGRDSRGAGASQAAGITIFDNDPAFARELGRHSGAGLAFEMTQRMVEGSAAAAVGQIGTRLASGSGEVAELMRERQDIARQIDALFRGGEAGPGEMARLSGRLKELSERLAELRPDHNDLFDPRPMSVDDLSGLLPDESTFVLISSTKAATYVFAVRGGEIDWHRAPIGAAELEKRVSRLRASLDPDATNRGATPLTGSRAPRTRAFDRKLAHDIYRDLLLPVAGFLADDHLYVVANGPLASLPLSVLVRSRPEGNDDDPVALRETDWLARAHPITLLPSPAALRLAELQRSRPPADLPFIGFGDPVFSLTDKDDAPFSRLAALPGTRAEVKRLAELLGAGEESIFLGDASTKDAILGEDLSRARVLAFATHGLLAGQMPQAQEPGLVFTHPRTGAPADDSYLTASEAAMLDINADWVLLSACNTAGSDGRPDSEGLSGLARAFLFAGARSVLISYWPVRDDAAMLLTTEALSWHEEHPSAPRAAALRHAMVVLLSRDDTPDFAHPSAWAPFVLLGDG